MAPEARSTVKGRDKQGPEADAVSPRFFGIAPCLGPLPFPGPRVNFLETLWVLNFHGRLSIALPDGLVGVESDLKQFHPVVL
jgi:hypothetical protein